MNESFFAGVGGVLNSSFLLNSLELNLWALKGD